MCDTLLTMRSRLQNLVGSANPMHEMHGNMRWEFIASLAAMTVPFLVVVALLVYPYCFSPLRHLPGPKGNWPLFGQCYKLLHASWVPQLFHEWSRQWPRSPLIRYIGIANSECLVANSITAYKEILQTKSASFVKPTLTRRCFRLILGDGLPFAEDISHRHRRAALMKSFNTSHVKSLVPVMQAKVEQLVDVLVRECTLSEEIEVESRVWKTVLDIIGIDVLGVDLNHMESTVSPLHALFQHTTQQSAFGHVIHYLSSYMPLRSLMRTPKNSSFLENCAKTRKYLKTFLDSRRATSWHGEEYGKDSLQNIIDRPDLWDDSEAVEYLLNLMVLGHDTTACTIVWALHLLSHHPLYQVRLREEITNQPVSQKNFAYKDLEQLTLMNRFLMEVLRLYCPVAYIPRESIEDVEIDGVFVPKGTVVNLCPAVLNLHPLVWGEDASQFNPDRWESLEGLAANAYAFETFHHGPRTCIGKQLAMTEMKVVLVKILSQFSLEAVDSAEQMRFASPSFTLRPKMLLKLKLLPIS